MYIYICKLLHYLVESSLYNSFPLSKFSKKSKGLITEFFLTEELRSVPQRFLKVQLHI